MFASACSRSRRIWGSGHGPLKSCRTTPMRAPRNRVDPSLGTPGIRAQETDINNPAPKVETPRQKASTLLIHSTKRVENVTRTRQQGYCGSLVRWVLGQSLEAGDYR